MGENNALWALPWYVAGVAAFLFTCLGLTMLCAPRQAGVGPTADGTRDVTGEGIAGGSRAWVLAPCDCVLAPGATQIVISNVQSAASYRAAHRNWLYLFFPEDYDFSECVCVCVRVHAYYACVPGAQSRTNAHTRCDSRHVCGGSPTTYLYTPNASIDAIQRAVTNYYHVNNVSLDTFQYVPHSTTASPVPLAVTKYRAGGPKFWAGDVEFNSALESHVWLLSPDNLGPVDPSRYSHSDIVSFFSSVQTMTAYYALQSYQLGPL